MKIYHKGDLVTTQAIFTTNLDDFSETDILKELPEYIKKNYEILELVGNGEYEKIDENTHLFTSTYRVKDTVLDADIIRTCKYVSSRYATIGELKDIKIL